MYESPKHPEWEDDFDEGNWYYSKPKDKMFEVVYSDIEFDYDTHTSSGELVIIDENGDTTVLVAGDVYKLGLPDDVSRIPDRVVSDPESILLEFANKEIQTYVSRLGESHDYNGISGVEKIRDLVLAERVMRHD